MDIRHTNPWFTVSVYLAPIHHSGLVAAWGNKHTAWKSGFIVRVLWLGFVLRWGKLPAAQRQQREAQRRINYLIQQANDGDYPLSRAEIAALLGLQEEPF